MIEDTHPDITANASDVEGLAAALRRLSNTKTIEFIRGSRSRRASDRNVIVGNYALSRVDLDDVEAFGFTSSHSVMMFRTWDGFRFE